MPVSLNSNIVQVPNPQSNKFSKIKYKTTLSINVEPNVAVESSLVALGSEGVYLAKRDKASKTTEKIKIKQNAKEERTNNELKESSKARTLDEFSKMLNENYYKNSKKDLINIYKSNPDIQVKIDSWVNEKKIDSNGQNVPRFNAYDIKILVGIYKSNPDMQEKIDGWIKEKTIDSNGNEVHRFGANKIKNIVDLYKSNPDMQEEIDGWIKEKTIDSNGNEVYRFGANKIKNLVNLYKSNPDMQEEIEGWIKEKTIDSNGNEVSRFNADDIENLVDLYKLNPAMQGKIEGWIKEKTIDSNNNDVSRFNADDIENLVDLYKSNPEIQEKMEGWINEKTINLSGNEVHRFSANNIKTLVDLYKSNPEMQGKIEGWIREKTPEYNGKEVPSFNATDIYKMVNMYKKYPEFVDKVCKNPKLSVLLNALTWENYNIVNDDAILNFIEEMELNKITSMQVEQLNTENEYKIFTEKGNKSEILIVQRKPNNRVDIISNEIVKKEGNNSLVRREFPNGQFVVEKIDYIDETKRRPIGQKKTIYDSNGIPLLSEVLTPSSDKVGEYTINVYERGLNKSMEKKSIGTVNLYGTNSQGSRVERKLTSNDGTTTKQTKIYGPKGSGTKYEILDKDGNILYSQERRQRKIDDNHYTSSLNGQKYDIKFEKEAITASRLDNDGNVLETVTLGPDIIDFRMKEMFKGLYGDYLFKIKEMGISKISIDESEEMKNNAYYNSGDHSIMFSKESMQNKYMFAHELGHALDIIHLKDLNKDAEFLKRYKEELAQYKSTTTETEAHSIDYFINDPDRYLETIAEIHALISGLNNDESAIQLRGVVLQQNFPKTIAYVAKKLEKQ